MDTLILQAYHLHRNRPKFKDGLVVVGMKEEAAAIVSTLLLIMYLYKYAADARAPVDGLPGDAHKEIGQGSLI